VNFRKRTPSAEPEINLIPFIDVLLVVLIFLMLTTTWSRLTEINMTLPLADGCRFGAIGLQGGNLGDQR
jgi:biopolymer transport protein ExbD